MVVKVATTTCLNWIQPSAISSKRPSIGSNGVVTCRYVRRMDQSFLSRTQFFKLCRSQSCEQPKLRTRTIRRASSCSLDSFWDDEYSKEIQELALKFQFSDDDSEFITDSVETWCENISSDSEIRLWEDHKAFDLLEQPEWPEREDIIPASIERKANSVDLPLSLRIIKRKKQWKEEFREVGESAYCSVKKAFSNMVFIIRELQSYTLQMRETLFYEDLQGILVRVQQEMHASFVWLFQKVFSHTPTLMVYVMILLANYSVHSMASSTAIAATPPPQAGTVETASAMEERNVKQKFDSSAMKTFSVSSSSGKSTSIGGSNGGGGRPVSSGTDGDDRFDERLILPNGVSSSGDNIRIVEEEYVSGNVAREEEELHLWNSIVDEASRMQAELRDEALDHETTQRFVSPVNANIEADDYADYFRTEMLYLMGVAREPQNPLLLANFAQFLCLVVQDYDRAEEYFKKAAEVEPKDAEALNKYATFLWQVRKDLWAAEEVYQDAIAVEPDNAFYMANYANFLWETGNEDICFPLDSPNTDI